MKCVAFIQRLYHLHAVSWMVPAVISYSARDEHESGGRWRW